MAVSRLIDPSLLSLTVGSSDSWLQFVSMAFRLHVALDSSVDQNDTFAIWRLQTVKWKCGRLVRNVQRNRERQREINLVRSITVTILRLPQIIAYAKIEAPFPNYDNPQLKIIRLQFPNNLCMHTCSGRHINNGSELILEATLLIPCELTYKICLYSLLRLLSIV